MTQNVIMKTDVNLWPCDDQKIESIKVIRAILGYGLKDAKDLVEGASEAGGKPLTITVAQIKEFRSHGFSIKIGRAHV